LELSRLDSLYQLEEEEEAHLPVVLSRRGAVCSAVAKVVTERCEVASVVRKR
jgi:hypothetical protein